MVCARAGAAKPSRQASDSSVAPSRLLAEGAASAKRVFVVSMLVSLEWWWREDRMIHDARFHHPSTSGDDDLRLAEVRTLLVGGGMLIHSGAARIRLTVSTIALGLSSALTLALCVLLGPQPELLIVISVPTLAFLISLARLRSLPKAG